MICPNCGHDNLPGSDLCENCEQALTALDLPTPQNQVERSLMEDPVRYLGLRPPITVSPDTSIEKAVAIMLEANIGAVLVVDDQGRLAGIFSERDLLKKIVGLHTDLSKLTVGEFMTPNPETVTPSDPLNFALHRMDIGDYRHLPIIADDRPIGMLSVRDMLRHITAVCQEV